VACQRNLLQVVLAAHAVGCLTHLLHRWNQKADQNRDDGDHHQQFDQRKTLTLHGITPN